MNKVVATLINALLSPLAPVRQSPYQGAMPLAYRPDIDGLRAVAVAAVVIFHAFPTVLPGGFIGVDIFFVISGYLITSIIVQDIEQHRFSIARFYSRRIRRIFPALACVLLSVLVFGWFSLVPEEYAALGKHVLGGAGFVSNIVLWMEAGYFDAASQFKILLHFWSLGIEEQFYIFFPLLLMGCYRLKKPIIPIIIALFILSFADNLYLSPRDQIAVFYFPLARIWELLAGALLSVLFRSPRAWQIYMRIDRVLAHAGRQSSNDGHSLSLLLACLGVFLLCAAFSIAREGEPYPGWTALLPVSGAVFLIAAGPANPFSKYILSNRLAVFIGLISYPLYLWHWPLLSYTAVLLGGLDEAALLLRILLVCLAVTLATMTYFFIERPLRFHKTHTTRQIIVLFSLVMMCGLAGGYVFSSKGFPGRMASGREDTAITALKVKLNAYKKNCLEMLLKRYGYDGNLICMAASSFETTDAVLIGDSHAGHLYPGLVKLLGDRKSLAVFPASCTPPYMGTSTSRTDIPDIHHGPELVQIGYDVILHTEAIKTVIIAHNPDCSYGHIQDSENMSLKDRNSILEKAMRRTFDALIKAKKTIIVVLDNPPLSFHPKACGDRPTELFNFHHQCVIEKSYFDNNTPISWYNTIFKKVVQDYPQIKVIDLSTYFCDEKFCYAKKDGKILYEDSNHLSIDGSFFVAPELAKILE